MLGYCRCPLTLVTTSFTSTSSPRSIGSCSIATHEGEARFVGLFVVAMAMVRAVGAGSVILVLVLILVGGWSIRAVTAWCVRRCSVGAWLNVRRVAALGIWAVSLLWIVWLSAGLCVVVSRCIAGYPGWAVSVGHRVACVIVSGIAIARVSFVSERIARRAGMTACGHYGNEMTRMFAKPSVWVGSSGYFALQAPGL